MKPKPQTGDATGGPEQPISTPLDKPPKEYLIRDTTPRDDFHEEAFDEGSMENSGDLSRRFM